MHVHKIPLVQCKMLNVADWCGTISKVFVEC